MGGRGSDTPSQLRVRVRDRGKLNLDSRSNVEDQSKNSKGKEESGEKRIGETHPEEKLKH